MTSASNFAAPENHANSPATYDLRPLSTGEVLDRAFQLYRSRFALFASLAALPAAVQFIGGVVQVLTAHTEQVVRNGRTLTVATHLLAASIISIVTLLVFFIVYGITQAASTWAVAEIYLGKAASLRAAWQTATADWVRYVRVVLRQYWNIFRWPMLATILLIVGLVVPGTGAKIAAEAVAGLVLAGSLIYAILVALRVSLAVPAAVIESLNAGEAVRRSTALLTERKVRIFLLWLLLAVVGVIIGLALMPLQFLAVRTHGTERHIYQMLNLTGTFLSSLLIGPIGAIGLCLFYFDERVRHEGFDIEFLMQRAGGGPPADSETDPLAEGSQSPELA